MSASVLYAQFCASQKEFIAFLRISLIPLMQSADFVTCCKCFIPCLRFLSVVYVLHAPPREVARGIRPGDLTGQACGPKQVRDTREWCLPEVGGSLKVVQKNWYRAVMNTTLKHYSACSDVMVNTLAYFDRAFFIQNDSYNILTFGTPCTEHSV
jgi:hypothetical protein